MICYTHTTYILEDLDSYMRIGVVWCVVGIVVLKRESNIFPRIYSKYPFIIYYMINIGKMDF